MWHPKMLQRVELTGTAINPYNTAIDPQGTTVQPHGIVSVAEADYWFGGLVATGVAPQPIGFGGKPGPFDAAVGTWVKRYRNFGHFVETGVQTLHWDPACCHDGYGPAGDGACSDDRTWAPCRDVIATALAGGTHGSPAAGIYAGSATPVEVPQQLVPDNCTLVVFAASGAGGIHLAAGSPAHTRLRMAFLSAEPASAALTGGFWRLRGQNVRLTVLSDGGAVIEPAHDLWSEPQTGQMVWNGTVPAAEAGGLRRVYAFEKHA